MVTGQPAPSAGPRVLLVGAEGNAKATDVFELIEFGPAVVTVRSAFLFEIGEELKLRIEGDGEPREVTARVRAHLANGASELELAI